MGKRKKGAAASKLPSATSEHRDSKPWAADSPEWKRVAQQILDSTSQSHAELVACFDLYATKSNRTAELAEQINYFILDIRSSQEQILQANGLLGVTAESPYAQLLFSVENALGGMAVLKDANGELAISAPSIERLFESYWCQVKDIDEWEFPEFVTDSNNINWVQKYELIITWLRKQLASTTYFYAEQFAYHLDTLKWEVDRLPENEIREDQYSRIKSAYAAVLESYVKFEWCHNKYLSNAACEVYPIGTFPLRIKGFRATRSVLQLIEQEIGIWARNLLYQDKRLPTDYDSNEVRLKVESFSHSRAQGEVFLAYRIEKTLAMRNIGVTNEHDIENKIRDCVSKIDNDSIRHMCARIRGVPIECDILAIAVEQENRAVHAVLDKEWEESKLRVISEINAGITSKDSVSDPMQVLRLGKWYQQACDEYFVGVAPALSAKVLHYEQTHGTLRGTRATENGHWMYKAIDVVSYEKFSCYADAIRDAVSANFAGVSRKLSRSTSLEQRESVADSDSRK